MIKGSLCKLFIRDQTASLRHKRLWYWLGSCPNILYAYFVICEFFQKCWTRLLQYCFANYPTSYTKCWLHAFINKSIYRVISTPKCQLNHCDISCWVVVKLWKIENEDIFIWYILGCVIRRAAPWRTVWFGTARHGTARHGTARYGTARPYKTNFIHSLTAALPVRHEL